MTSKLIFYLHLYLVWYDGILGSRLTTPLLGDSYDKGMLFHHDLGIFIEPNSFAYSYSTFVYERIHMIVPFNYELGYHLDNCNEDENQRTRAEITQLILSLQRTLADRIDEYQSPVISEENREKREIILLSLLAAAAIMSVGLSLYNSYQIRKLSDETKMAAIEINRLSEAARKTPQVINGIIDQLNNITVVIPELGKKINTIITTLNCEQTRSAFFRDLDRQINNDIILRVTSGINALYSGKITPDFYPISTVKKTLLQREDMLNSLYRDDISLVYKLGNFVTLAVKHDPFSITGVLILPKLLRENIGVTLMINKVPIHDSEENTLIILDEPDVGVQDMTASIVWTPDMSLCIKHTGTYFCPLYDVKSRYSRCLTGLVFGQNASTCVFKKSTNDPLVKQANNGLLLSSKITEFSIISKDRDGHNKAMTKRTMHANSSNLVTAADGREILIKDEIYMMAPETAEIATKIVLNQTASIPPITPISIPSLSPLDHMDPFDPHYLHLVNYGFTGTSIALFIILLLCSFIIFQLNKKVTRLYMAVQRLERAPLL